MSELTAPEKILKKIAVAALCIILVIYVGRQLVSLVDSNIETETALAVTSKESFEVDGYIMRRESILPGKENGVMLAAVRDGARISKDREAVRVYYSEEDRRIAEQIRDIDAQSEILRKSIMDTSYVSADMDKMDDEINELISNSLIYNAENDLAGALNGTDDLLIRMNKRWLISNPGKVFEEKMKSLDDKRTGLERQLSGNYSLINAPQSGLYYAYADGYESIFSSDKIASMSVDEFEAMTKSTPESFGVKPAGKIVTDYKWYLACPVSEEQSKLFDPGKTYGIEFTYSYGTTVNMLLHSRITENGKDSAVLVFSSGEMPQEFDFARIQKVRLVYNEYKGLKIPKEAVRVINDVKGVFVISGTQVEFKRAEEIYSFDEYYIIEQNPESEKYAEKYVRSKTVAEDGTEKETYFRALSLYDNVIVKGRNVYDGMKIER